MDRHTSPVNCPSTNTSCLVFHPAGRLSMSSHPQQRWRLELSHCLVFSLAQPLHPSYGKAPLLAVVRLVLTCTALEDYCLYTLLSATYSKAHVLFACYVHLSRLCKLLRKCSGVLQSTNLLFICFRFHFSEAVHITLCFITCGLLNTTDVIVVHLRGCTCFERTAD